MRGDATKVAADLRTRTIKYALGVIIFAAIAFGAVKLYQSHPSKYVPKT